MVGCESTVGPAQGTSTFARGPPGILISLFNASQVRVFLFIGRNVAPRQCRYVKKHLSARGNHDIETGAVSQANQPNLSRPCFYRPLASVTHEKVYMPTCSFDT